MRQGDGFNLRIDDKSKTCKDPVVWIRKDGSSISLTSTVDTAIVVAVAPIPKSLRYCSN